MAAITFDTHKFNRWMLGLMLAGVVSLIP